MANSQTDHSGVSTTSVTDPDPPADVSLREKSRESGTSRTQTSEYELPDQQSADSTRRNSLSSGTNLTGEHKSPKALEAGFPGVIEKGGVMIVDWDGPEDPLNPLKYEHKACSGLLCSYMAFSVGRTRRNGLQRSSFPVR